MTPPSDEHAPAVLITKSPTAPIERPTKDAPKPAKAIAEGMYYSVDLNRWYDAPLSVLQWTWRITKQLPRMTWGLINIFIGVKMTKVQRIAAGLTSIIIGAAAIFGFDLSVEVAGAITSVVALIVGLLIPSGTTTPNP